ncbi:hypothetical protein [uncultured Desulfobulbus sp.]|uniref:hypothetical protein n=1 Tax=uncultured Desulfobulbus sp. TaxID=239745 RepID=UPI0029C72625|nr:hypothetical protein [uncultured Desulfobulbus sp.]
MPIHKGLIKINIDRGICVFRLNPATIPAGKRPPFRWEKGQHSDLIAASIPTKKASVE